MDNPEFSNPNNGRRSFLKQTAITAAMLATTDFAALAINDFKIDGKLGGGVPWYRKVTRWGQINITEKDPGQYDIEWWRKFWKQTDTEGVIVNAGGIVAYYST